MFTKPAGRALATALLFATTALTAPAFAQTAATAPAANGSGTNAGGFTGTLPTDVGHVGVVGQTTPDGVTGQDFGGGYIIQEDQPKQRSTVTRDAIAKQSPTANPYQLISLLPGVHQASPDNNGLNGGDITLHGFFSSELGLTIDGMPVNDSGNYALYPQEYVDAENLQQVSIAPGYSDLDSPHIGATGGVINIYSRDPSQEAGGFVDFGYGTKKSVREFIRLETGQIGRFRGYASYSHYEDDHWRGPGGDYRDNYEFKGVVDVREASKITVSALLNIGQSNFYYNPSKANFSIYGANSPRNNYDPAFNPGGTLTAPSKNNGYYATAVNPFTNLILTAPSQFTLTDELQLDVTPYFWYGFGNGGGTSALGDTNGLIDGGNRLYTNGGVGTNGYDVSGTGSAISSAVKPYFYTPSITQTYRPGIISKFTYDLGNHKLVAGVMLEDANHKQYGTVSPLNADGTAANVYGDGADNIVIKNATGSGAAFNGQLYQKRDSITRTRTFIGFTGDEAKFLNDALTVDVGVKYISASRHIQNLLPSGPLGYIPPYENADETSILPTIAATYKVTEHNSVFLGFGTSYKAVPNFTLQAYPSITSTSTSNVLSNYAFPVKPETAQTVEFGHRFQGDFVTSSVSIFGAKFQNRQFNTNIADPSGSGATEAVTLNIGDTTTYGIDGEVGLKPWHNFRPYVSGEYLHATQDGWFPTVATVSGKPTFTLLNTSGKYIPTSPSLTSSVGIDYDDGHVFGNFNAQYTGMQYSTLVNDEKIPPYTTLNAGFGYRFQDYLGMKAPTLRVNLNNLLDQHVLTGAFSPNANAQTKVGNNGVAVSGSAPSYYVSQGFSMFVTMSAGF